MPLPLTAVFADLPDPRIETANKLHQLTDILVIATCAVIAGADGWEDIAEYGRSKEAFFRRFLELPNGIPSHDTFDRVFAKLDPDAFADRFGRWMAGLCEATGLVHVAIDGKSRATVGEGHVHRVPAPGQRVGRREPADPRPAVGARRRARDHHGPRPAGGAGPGRGGGDARRGRVPEGDRRADPRAGRRLRGVREGQPEGAARRGGRGVRAGGRGGVRRVRHGRRRSARATGARRSGT